MKRTKFRETEVEKEIKVLYHGDLLDIIKSKGQEGLCHIGGKSKSVCIDLYCAEDVTIEAGQFAYINLGVSIKLPEGYEANIVPRSSTYKNWGIIQTNSFGIIDTNYSGEKDVWKMPIFNLLTQQDLTYALKQMLQKGLQGKITDGTTVEVIDNLINSISFRKVTIKAGERIAQMKIVRVMDDFKINTVDNLDEEVARGGFGEGTGV